MELSKLLAILEGGVNQKLTDYEAEVEMEIPMSTITGDDDAPPMKMKCKVKAANMEFEVKLN